MKRTGKRSSKSRNPALQVFWKQGWNDCVRLLVVLELSTTYVEMTATASGICHKIKQVRETEDGQYCEGFRACLDNAKAGKPVHHLR